MSIYWGNHCLKAFFYVWYYVFFENENFELKSVSIFSNFQGHKNWKSVKFITDKPGKLFLEVYSFLASNADYIFQKSLKVLSAFLNFIH